MGVLIKPRSIVKLNGKPVPFKSWSIDNNASSQADTFNVVFDMSSIDVEYLFHTEDDLYIEIYLGFIDGGNEYSEKDLTFMISGYTDELDWQFDQWEVGFIGRDKTGLLIDKKLTARYANLTALQVIKQLGEAEGLKIDTSGIRGDSKKVGALVNGDQVLLHSGSTAWDLITRLAEEENREAFVKGDTLYYRDRLLPWEQEYFYFRWDIKDGDLANLKLNQAKRNTRDISVTVKTWNSSQKKAFSYTARRDNEDKKIREKPLGQNRLYKKKRKANQAADIEYLIIRQGLTPAEVKALAENTADFIIRYELVANFSLPISDNYSLDRLIFIDNIPSPTKQFFHPTQIRTSFDPDNGGRVDFTAVNHILPVRGEVS